MFVWKAIRAHVRKCFYNIHDHLTKTKLLYRLSDKKIIKKLYYKVKTDINKLHVYRRIFGESFRFLMIR